MNLKPSKVVDFKYYLETSPTEAMFDAVIKHGNAVSPYREIAHERFHTKLAAQMFGTLECVKLCKSDQYHYWSVKNPIRDTSGHMA
jgi:hypothetical protein